MGNAISKKLKYLEPILIKLIQTGKTECFDGSNAIADGQCANGGGINNGNCGGPGAGADSCNANGQGALPGMQPLRGCNAGYRVGKICADGNGAP
jgi:hypothetical protein